MTEKQIIAMDADDLDKQYVRVYQTLRDLVCALGVKVVVPAAHTPEQRAAFVKQSRRLLELEPRDLVLFLDIGMLRAGGAEGGIELTVLKARAPATPPLKVHMDYANSHMTDALDVPHEGKYKGALPAKGSKVPLYLDEGAEIVHVCLHSVLDLFHPENKSSDAALIFRSQLEQKLPERLFREVRPGVTRSSTVMQRTGAILRALQAYYHAHNQRLCVVLTEKDRKVQHKRLFRPPSHKLEGYAYPTMLPYFIDRLEIHNPSENGANTCLLIINRFLREGALYKYHYETGEHLQLTSGEIEDDDDDDTEDED